MVWISKWGGCFKINQGIRKEDWVSILYQSVMKSIKNFQAESIIQALLYFIVQEDDTDVFKNKREEY